MTTTPEEVDPPDETALAEFLSQTAADEGLSGADDEDE